MQTGTWKATQMLPPTSRGSLNLKFSSSQTPLCCSCQVCCLLIPFLFSLPVLPKSWCFWGDLLAVQSNFCDPVRICVKMYVVHVALRMKCTRSRAWKGRHSAGAICLRPKSSPQPRGTAWGCSDVPASLGLPAFAGPALVLGRPVLPHPCPLRSLKFILPRLHGGAQAAWNLPKCLYSPPPSCCLPAFLHASLWDLVPECCSRVPATVPWAVYTLVAGSSLQSETLASRTARGTGGGGGDLLRICR